MRGYQYESMDGLGRLPAKQHGVMATGLGDICSSHGQCFLSAYSRRSLEEMIGLVTMSSTVSKFEIRLKTITVTVR
jgi:hypothetical protein